MQRTTLIATLLAAAFALPLSAVANTGKTMDDKSASASTAAASGNDGGAEAMFKALDKNNDGFLSEDEVKGTPHEKDFAMLDKNGDGKLSRDEHYNAPEHVAARDKAAGKSTSNDAASTTTASADTSGGKKY